MNADNGDGLDASGKKPKPDWHWDMGCQRSVRAMDNEEDATCYMVEERAFEYDYDEGFDWENMTAAQCNCSHPLHKFLEACDFRIFLKRTDFFTRTCHYENETGSRPHSMNGSTHMVCVSSCFNSPNTLLFGLTEEELFEAALPAVLYLIVFLVGTVGNAMVIFVVNRFKRMRNVTNVFLASLSTADLCLIWFCVPIMMLLLIVFPVVTMSICYARVSVIVYTSSKSRLALSQAMVAFSKAATDAVHFSGYSTIPMISTSRELKTATSTINAYTKHKSARVAEANKKQIVQMLISIVVMYTVCWLPTIVDELLTSFGYICRTSNTPSLKHMRMGFNALGMEEMRSRMGSCSSASMLSTRNQQRIYGSSFNTLTVPGRTAITPNMSRDVSQLSLCRPVSSLSTRIAADAPSTYITRKRNSTTTCRETRPRSPTDVSLTTRPKYGGIRSILEADV
ncbi:7 transmembrane receptor [Teladorsagia circumcincta]|uniref:7 transmembrane receptor n=1 Tax=Teladorsagia circumcincta TaxID=45464 RepID=A0A2G9UVQ8_TELCI|nr:7 transmembrane receptor [Teladorsagia circumcincta]